ncbi:MAG: hypothetical protein IJ236_06575 [Oscillospiraceae bacterium]|nr:hypothetical protein [Oscillospiraceae bacterium]MBQ9695576.1 hypothetical protein [Oscillospiraceae bacterium]MBR1459451.1 hypothetical protein [Oscillospiraceae bacterium]
MLSAILASRYVRIRSWKDVVAIIITALVYGGLLYLLPRIFPNLPQNAVKIISFIVGVIVCIIMLFALDA